MTSISLKETIDAISFLFINDLFFVTNGQQMTIKENNSLITKSVLFFTEKLSLVQISLLIN